MSGFGTDSFNHVSKYGLDYPLIVHFHAVAFVGWLTFFTVQVGLIRTARADIHRRLGILGAGLAAIMVVLGPATAFHVDAARFQGLAGDAMFAAFFSLPDAIERDSTFCSIHFTDSPTATVSVFLPTRSKRVVDDHGCVWTPAALRDLENAIDEVAGSKQWAYTAP